MDPNSLNLDEGRHSSQPLIGSFSESLPPVTNTTGNDQSEDQNSSMVHRNQGFNTVKPGERPHEPCTPRLNPSSNPIRQRHRWSPKRIATLMPSKMIVIIALAIIITLLIYSTSVLSKNSLLNPSVTIGGKFSQSTAKTIDFCWSFGAAPLLYWTLDAYFFSIGRVTMVNENSRHPTSLQSLAEASGTDAGTYNFFKLHRLLFRSTGQMKLFAALSVFSAIGVGTLSNAIAYEAITALDDYAKTPVQLRSLNWDPVLAWDSDPRNPKGAGFSNPQQQLNFSSEAVAMLTKLAYQNAIPLLEPDGTYIGINATQDSINSLDASIGFLKSVPAYKLSIDCDTMVPDSLSTNDLSMASYLTTLFNMSEFAKGTITQYRSYLSIPSNSYPEGPRSMGNNFQFVGFDLENMIAHLGTLRRYYLTEKHTPVSTPYGNVNCKYFNMSVYPAWTHGGDLDEPCLYGMRCKLLRQTGTVDYRRETNGSWTKIPVMFNPEKTTSPMLLSLWQLLLNFQVPIPYLNQGFGAAFWNSALIKYGEFTGNNESTTDYVALAANLLYGASEMERMTLEGLNSVLAGGPGLFEVEAARNDLVYQITYVPALLFAAVVATTSAAIISIGMVAYSWKSKSFKEWRRVDTLRLLVDAVYGLEDEWVQDIQEKENSELNDWAKRFPVRYVRQRDSGGDERVRLVRKRYLTTSIISSVNAALFDPK